MKFRIDPHFAGRYGIKFDELTKMDKKIYFSFVFIAALVAGFFMLSYQKKVMLFSEKKEVIQTQPITFLLLGKTGKVVGWNLSPDLADAIIVVDWRPAIGAVNLVSLPRDLYVNFFGEKMKLNEVTRMNKINDLIAKLPELTGMETDKYIVVDIDILKIIVDAMGGIDIVLDQKAIDWVSGFTMDAGPQHLDGEKAVWLARNRFSPEGDFFREKNQHDIIKAIAEKYPKLNPIEKTSVMFKILPEVSQMETNIDFQQLMPTFEKFSGARFNDIVMDFSSGLVVSATTTIGTSTGYILLPKSGNEDYNEIKGYIQGKLEK